MESDLFTKGVLYDKGIVVNTVNYLSNMCASGIEKSDVLPENSFQILSAQQR
jgi:hypothetical protein